MQQNFEIVIRGIGDPASMFLKNMVFLLGSLPGVVVTEALFNREGFIPITSPTPDDERSIGVQVCLNNYPEGYGPPVATTKGGFGAQMTIEEVLDEGVKKGGLVKPDPVVVNVTT